MNHKTVFAALAFLFSAAAYVPYTASVLAGDAHPTISSWISWGIMDVTILAGMIMAGEMAWQMLAYLIGCVTIITTSIWRGATVGWTHLDSICLAVVVVAVALWAVLKKPNVLIILSLAATIIGTIPTVVSVWKNPANEPLLPWLLIGVGAICGVLAVKKWNIAAAATPICFITLQVLVLFLMIR